MLYTMLYIPDIILLYILNRYYSILELLYFRRVILCPVRSWDRRQILFCRFLPEALSTVRHLA